MSQVDELYEPDDSHHTEEEAMLGAFNDESVVFSFEGQLIDVNRSQLLDNCYILAAGEHWWLVDDQHTARYIHEPNETVQLAAMLLGY